MWIEDLGLAYADKHLIEYGYNVKAAIINASSRWIRQENNIIEGLLPIVEPGGYKGNGGLFVQIFKVSENHWITLSNLFKDYGNVSVYDSAMRMNYRWESKEIRYDVAIELDACNLRFLPHHNMMLYVKDTKPYLPLHHGLHPVIRLLDRVTLCSQLWSLVTTHGAWPTCSREHGCRLEHLIFSLSFMLFS